MRNYTTPEKSSKRSPSRVLMPHTSPSLPIDAPLLHTADTPVKNRSTFAAAESTVCCVSSRAMMLVSVVVVTLIVWLFGTSMPCETFHVLCANRCVRSVTSRVHSLRGSIPISISALAESCTLHLLHHFVEMRKYGPGFHCTFPAPVQRPHGSCLLYTSPSPRD